MTIQFKTMSEFFAMGEHGVYVWSCYAIVLFCVLIGIAMSINSRKQAWHEIRRHQAREIKNYAKKTHLTK